MKTYKVFERDEINKAMEDAGLATSFLEHLDGNFCNDVAVHWYVETISDEDVQSALEEDKESGDNYGQYLRESKVINEYLLSQGCKEDEMVYIDVTW